MKRLRFEFEVVTPMFIGGASPNGEAEIRPPSIKGLLRWWFRALGGSKKWEARLFGATGIESSESKPHPTSGRDRVRRKEASKSRVHIRVISGQSFRVKKAKEERFSGELGYLGYGPIGWDKEARVMVNQRPFIEPGSTFSLQVGMLNLRQKDYYALLLSIWAFANFGGIGSRSRRGWGSVRIIEAPEKGYLRWTFESSKEFYRYLPRFFNKIQTIFDSLPEFPEYPEFSQKSRIVVGKELTNHEETLSNIGEIMIDFRKRKYYHDIKRLMIEAEKNPNRLSYQWKATGNNIQYSSPVPKAIFGLPNNYMSRTRRGDRNRPPRYPWQISVDAVQIYGNKKEDINRRASPLLIKIAKWENEKHSWIVTYLPSKFLPDGAILKLSFPKGGLPDIRRTHDQRLIDLHAKLKDRIITANPPNFGLLDEFVRELEKEGPFAFYITEVSL